MDRLVGQSLDAIDTPALVLDLDRFESNVAHLVAYCRRHDVGWRPHSKAHKSTEIARRQMEAGAIGVTCAKLSEAEIMASQGISEILLANQLTSGPKLRRLARLQQNDRRVIGIVDDLTAAQMAASAGKVGASIPLLIDVDVGMHRTGVQPCEVLKLACAIEQLEGIELLGIMGYEGHVLNEPMPGKRDKCREALDHLVQARDELRAAGIACDILSAGGTGSYELTAGHPGMTEIQAGGGIFMDAMYRDLFGVGEELDYALTVLCTVSSRSQGHVVVDAGFKTLSAFHHPPRVLSRNDLTFSYLSAEHGVFGVIAGDGPALGERLCLLPGYSDSTTVLHDFFWLVRDGRIEGAWPIEGRGALT